MKVKWYFGVGKMKWAYSDIYLYLWNAKPSHHQQGPRATFKMFWFVIQIQIQCIAITSILAFRFQRVPESSKLRAPNSGFSQCVKTHSFWRGGLPFLSFHSSLNVVFYNVPSKLEQNIFVPKLSYKPNLANSVAPYHAPLETWKISQLFTFSLERCLEQRCVQRFPT